MTGSSALLRPVLDRLIAARPDVHAVLFEGERRVPLEPLERAIGGEGVAWLVTAGLIAVTGGAAAAQVRVDRVERLLVASDLRRHRLQRDFVVGPGPAGFLLARHVARLGRGPILDLGTGSGIQGLLAASGRQPVLALDINPRAVAFARFNAALNERPAFAAELGDFLTVTDSRLDGRFGTAIANPPFVLSPSADVTYRDRPLPGDAVGARTVERVARSLARGGRGYVLCNWIDRGGGWADPVRGWLRGTGVDASVRRVASLGPSAYAETWTRDVEPAARAAAAGRWRAHLVAEGVERIHVGVIALVRPRFRRLRPGFEAIDATSRTGATSRFGRATAH